MKYFNRDYITIKYPGYFWNLKTKSLYSIRSGRKEDIRKGKLVKLKKQFSTGRFISYVGYYYTISFKGNPTILTENSLLNLKKDQKTKNIKLTSWLNG